MMVLMFFIIAIIFYFIELKKSMFIPDPLYMMLFFGGLSLYVACS